MQNIINYLLRYNYITKSDYLIKKKKKLLKLMFEIFPIIIEISLKTKFKKNIQIWTMALYIDCKYKLQNKVPKFLEQSK